MHPGRWPGRGRGIRFALATSPYPQQCVICRAASSDRPGIGLHPSFSRSCREIRRGFIAGRRRIPGPLVRPRGLDARVHADVRRLADARRAERCKIRKPDLHFSDVADGVADRLGDPGGCPASDELRDLGRPVRRQEDDDRTSSCFCSPRCRPTCSAGRPTYLAVRRLRPDVTGWPATPSPRGSPGTRPGSRRQQKGLALGVVFGGGNVGASGDQADGDPRTRPMLTMVDPPPASPRQGIVPGRLAVRSPFALFGAAGPHGGRRSSCSPRRRGAELPGKRAGR